MSHIFTRGTFSFRSFYLVSPNVSELRLPLERRFDQSELTCQVNNKALDQPLMTSTKLNVQCKRKRQRREEREDRR